MRRWPILPVLLLVAFGAPAGTALASGGSITGASTANCSPNPCTIPQSPTAVTLPNVSNDDGTHSTRAFAVYRPGGLLPGPANRAPALLYFYPGGNCGFINPGRFIALSAPHRFLVVAMEVPCSRNNWDKHNVDSPGPSVPDDEPYVRAVVQAITQCPVLGAAAYQCADPQRLYVVGSSSGGNMAADIMCDRQNSSLFRGYMIDSSSIEQFGGTPHCPTTNRSFFVMLALSNYGIDRYLYYDAAPSPHLDVPAFADWAAQRLGCSAPRVDGAVGSPQPTTLTYTYAAPCAYANGGDAVEALGVQNGAHTFGCQDSDPNSTPFVCTQIPSPPGLTSTGLPQTNGLYLEQDFVTFFEQGSSSTTPASPFVDTSPPAVGVTGPAPGTIVSGRLAISAGATDDGSVASIQLQLDGRPFGAPGGVDSNGAYSLPWDTTTALNGVHLLSAVARDGAGNMGLSPAIAVNVENASAAPAAARWVALGDSLSAGDGQSPYFAGTNAGRDHCHRSLGAFANLAVRAAGIPGGGFAFRACADARMSQLTGPNRANHEPPQLRWVTGAARVVTVSIGWQDALLPAALQACVFAPSRCSARWGQRVGAAIAQLAGGSPRDRESLVRLYRRIAAAARHAKVLVVGYPLLFPSSPPPTCASGIAGHLLTASAMRWLNSAIAKLDAAIGRAARGAHVIYVRGSVAAFAGHTVCSRMSAVSGSMTPAHHPHQLASASFEPNALGELKLAQMVGRLL